MPSDCSNIIAIGMEFVSVKLKVLKHRPTAHGFAPVRWAEGCDCLVVGAAPELHNTWVAAPTVGTWEAVWQLVEVDFLASWQRRALHSQQSSLVAKAGDFFWLKVQSLTPRDEVTESIRSRVKSLCIHSLANPCQWAMAKSSSIIALLCGSGRRPSKTGIAHYIFHNEGN